MHQHDREKFLEKIKELDLLIELGSYENHIVQKINKVIIDSSIEESEKEYILKSIDILKLTVWE